MKPIFVDFDGVIHKFDKGWTGIMPQQEPVEGSLEAINLLLSKGFEVVIFTTREDVVEVMFWLKKYGFPDLRITNKKEPALAYIDDRGIRFTNWQDIIKYFI